MTPADSNATWADPGEQIFEDVDLDQGPNDLSFVVPCEATPTALTFARFRFNSAGLLSYDGPAQNGEVEDYAVQIEEPVRPPPDLDGDGDVDAGDIAQILAARNQPASGPDDPRDLDRDGMITVLDPRKAVLECTRPRCATE